MLKSFVNVLDAIAFSSNALRGAAVWERLGINLARYVSMPRKRCRASLLVGGVILFIACVFLGSGFNPSLVKMRPR